MSKKFFTFLRKFIVSSIIFLLVLSFFLIKNNQSQIALADSVGPNNPNSAVDDASVGTIVWTNPGNATFSDNVYATAALNLKISHYIKATNFGFTTIPAGSNITGILVEVEAKASSADCISDNSIMIIKGGARVGVAQWATNLVAGWLPTSDFYVRYGGDGNLWGTTWVVGDINNNSNFGVAVSYGNFDCGATTVSVDSIRITVYYSVPAANTPPNATSVTDSVGGVQDAPAVVGQVITFTGNWTDPDSPENVTMYICKTLTCANCNYVLQTGCWCSSGAIAKPTTTGSCTYPAQAGDVGTKDYWLGVCDDAPSCDGTPFPGGTFTVVAGSAPNVTSVSDNPDPQESSSPVAFSSTASDPDVGNTIKLYICKDSSCTNCDPSGTTNCWALTAVGVATNPSASYTCPSCTAATNNYWAKVCDNSNLCSGIIAGGSFSCKKKTSCQEPGNIAANCFSTYAFDGYCCDTSCGGTCQTCAKAGFLGTCKTRDVADNTECDSLPACFMNSYKCDGTNTNCVFTTAPNLHGFAWSEKIGWIGFNSQDCDPDGDKKTEGGLIDNPKYPQCPVGQDVKPYGVFLPSAGFEAGKYSATYQRNFCGYAWAGGGASSLGIPQPTIGWINFSPGTPATYYYPCFSNSVHLLYGYELEGCARACAGADGYDCYGEDDNQAAGGWGGWINTMNLFDERVDYFVELDNSEFTGWAWGGGGGGYCSVTTGQSCTKDENCPVVGEICTIPSPNSIIGWISFNHKNCDLDEDGVMDRTNGFPPNGDQGAPADCPADGKSVSDYKVTYEPVNQPPDPPANLSTTPNQCARGQELPAKYFSISFNWTYSDLDNTIIPGSDPQTAYEIWLDDNSTDLDIPANPKFKDLVDPSPSHSYNLNLSYNDNGPWLSKLAWNTTYYWKMKVRDSFGNWSDWSAISPLCSTLLPGQSYPGCFKTPLHASPYVNFSWCPTNPEVFSDTQFCSVPKDGECDPAPPDSTDDPPGLDEFCEILDETECYNNLDASVSCGTWSWIIESAKADPTVDNAPPPNDPNDVPVESTLENPSGIKFQTAGLKPVDLTITDSDGLQCTGTRYITLGLPLPTWKEITPFNP